MSTFSQNMKPADGRDPTVLALEYIPSKPRFAPSSSLRRKRRPLLSWPSVPKRQANGDDAEQKLIHDANEGTTEGCGSEGNKFVLALMTAVQSYSKQLRFPFSPPSVNISHAKCTTPQPSYLHEIESDESDDSGSESDSSTDEFDDDELLSNRPLFDSEEAMELLYQPSSPWAELVDAPIENPVVIAKLNDGVMCEACIKQGLLNGKKITYISKTWLLSQRWRGFFSELALYSDPEYLRPLQGVVIPKIIGIYLVEGAISVAMELPSSDFWVEASEDMSNYLKRKCIAAFDAIHDLGVLHNDVELRHTLISSRGDVMIIDFQQSCALEPLKAVGLEAATEADIRLEKRKVQFKLNYGNSREREIAKMRRVVKWEEQKRKRRNLRGRRAASRQSNSLPPLDEESEQEDPDDVLNPTVDPQTWENDWIGEPFIPACYIVPGQDHVEIGSAIQVFLMEELDRQDNDKTETTGESPESPAIVEKISLEVTQTSALPHSETEPILPTRITLKRGRDEADNSGGSPSKKRQLDQSDSTSGELGIEHGIPRDPALAPPMTATNVAGGGSASSSTCPDQPILGPEVHVPFEGYTGPGGYIITNIYSPGELGRLRRKWIQKHNIQRCIDNKLPYPLAESYELTPTTFQKLPIFDQNGKKVKEKVLRSQGALTRALDEWYFPGKRKRDAEIRKEKYLARREKVRSGLSDAEDKDEGDYDDDCGNVDVREGARIISPSELRNSCAKDPPPNHTGSTALKGILRRHLTAEEKARNVAHLEEEEEKKKKKKKRPLDSDASTDTGTVTDTEASRPPKRPCIDNRSPDGQAGSSSSRGVGFQRYAASPNAFSTRSSRSRSGSTRGSRLASVINSASRTSSANRSNGLSTGTSHGESSFSPRTPSTSNRDSGIASDSDSSSDGNDQGPSSSVRRPRRNRHRHFPKDGTSRILGYSAISVEEIDRYGGIPPRLPRAPPTEEEIADMSAVEETIVAENRRSWMSFTFSFPWKWPKFG